MAQSSVCCPPLRSVVHRVRVLVVGAILLWFDCVVVVVFFLLRACFSDSVPVSRVSLILCGVAPLHYCYCRAVDCANSRGIVHLFLSNCGLKIHTNKHSHHDFETFDGRKRAVTGRRTASIVACCFLRKGTVDVQWGCALAHWMALTSRQC